MIKKVTYQFKFTACVACPCLLAMLFLLGGFNCAYARERSAVRPEKQKLKTDIVIEAGSVGLSDSLEEWLHFFVRCQKMEPNAKDQVLKAWYQANGAEIQAEKASCQQDLLNGNSLLAPPCNVNVQDSNPEQSKTE